MKLVKLSSRNSKNISFKKLLLYSILSIQSFATFESVALADSLNLSLVDADADKIISVLKDGQNVSIKKWF